MQEGTDSCPIQIEESYFLCRRKYSRGLVLRGDRARNLDDENDGDIINDWGKDSNLDGAEIYGRDECAWIWVLGICKSNSQVRFVRVKNRKASTLLSVIQKYVESGGTI